MTDTTVLTDADHFDKLSEAINRGDDAEIARLSSQDVFDAVEIAPETPPEVQQPAEENAGQPPETPPEGAGDGGETQPAEDWISALPEDVQAKIKDEQARNTALQAELSKREHQSRSDSGRIRAYQQKLDELGRAPKETQPAPSSPKDDTGLAGLEALAEDDPALVAGLTKFGAEVERRASAVAKQVAESILRPAQEAQFHDYVSEQQRIVRETIPNVDEVTSHEHYQGWITRASENVRKMAASPHAEDAFNVMRLYTAQLAAEFPEDRPPSSNGHATSPPPAANTASADKLAGSRAARPQAPASPAQARATNVPAELDLDALFKQEYERAEKTLGL